jgi:hypothetical protein
MASVGTSSLRGDVLERDHILDEILKHVDEYSDKFDKIDYSALKDEVLKPVIAEDFDPETQIRGFLKTFRHTTVYKAAFASIPSEELKQQINDFIHGKHADDVAGDKFHLLSHSSPPVLHHFSLLEELKKLLVQGLDIKAVIKDGFHPQHKHVMDLPILYEDASEEKVVEVCNVRTRY